jgi:hypothetical protein
MSISIYARHSVLPPLQCALSRELQPLLDVPVAGAERQRGFVLGDGLRVSLLRDRDVPEVQVRVQRVREDRRGLVKLRDAFRFLSDLPERQAQVVVK